MITMKPMADKSAVDLFNKGRFAGPVQGYVASDGKSCIAYSLFLVKDEETVLLWAEAADTSLLDGILRASVAKGETDGAHRFSHRAGCPAVDEWFRVFFKNTAEPVANGLLFGGCCGAAPQ